MEHPGAGGGPPRASGGESLALGALAALGAALLAGVVEAIWVLGTSGAHLRALDLPLLAAVAAALVAAASVALVPAAVGLAALVRRAGLAEAVARLRARAAADEQAALAAGAALLAAPLAATATFAAALPLYARIIVFADPALATTASAAVAVACIVLFAVAWALFYAAARVGAERLRAGGRAARAAARLFRPRPALGLLGAGAVAGALAAALLQEDVVRALGLGRAAVAALPFAAAAALRLGLARLDRARRLARALRWWGALALVAAVATGGLLAALSAPARAHRHHNLRALHAPLGGAAWAALVGALDGDGDGHARLFGHDCDDANRAVNRGALDVPGDGIDQDCFEGDLPPSALPPPPPPRVRPPELAHVKNVVLLTVDAMRGDHTAAGGAAVPIVAAIDALGRRSVVFPDAWTNAPQTRRAVQAMLTGLLARSILWGDKHPHTEVKAANLTLPERIKPAGIDVLAFYGKEYLSKAPGFFQGFDLFDEKRLGGPGAPFKDRDIPASDLSDAIIREVSERAAAGRPFFVWAHYGEPHSPYDARPGYERFGPDVHGRYCQELAYVDDHIGRVIAAIEAGPAAGETAIIVTADHGEAFGEHGLTGHFQTLYDEETRIPLVVRVPGLAPRRVPGAVTLVDLAPTVLELLGVAWRDRMHGESLVPFLLGAPVPPARIVYMDLADRPWKAPRKVAVVRGPLKLILDVRRGSFELYDLAADRAERSDLVDDAPALVTDLRRVLTARRAGAEPAAAPAPAPAKLVPSK